MKSEIEKWCKDNKFKKEVNENERLSNNERSGRHSGCPPGNNKSIL